MAKYIINADDFGLRHSINQGILKLFKSGYITETTIMVMREGTAEAISLAKEHNLLVGLHIDLDNILQRHRFGIDERGVIKIPEDFFTSNIKEKIKKETTRQIEFLLSKGIEITHIDSHHHSHGFLPVLEIVCELADYYDIRRMRFYSNFYQTAEQLNSALDIIKKYNMVVPRDLLLPTEILSDRFNSADSGEGVYEIMLHPEDPELGQEKWRQDEFFNAEKIVSIIGSDKLVSFGYLKG